MAEGDRTRWNKMSPLKKPILYNIGIRGRTYVCACIQSIYFGNVILDLIRAHLNPDFCFSDITLLPIDLLSIYITFDNYRSNNVHLYMK